MDQITAQLEELTKIVKNVSVQQKLQDQRLVELANKINTTDTGDNPNVDSTPEPPAEGAYENLFNIPDPIKCLPTYDGNRRQLSAWLTTAKETLDTLRPLVTGNQYKMYVRAVLNKIEGKAKDILCLAGNPQDFSDVSDILTNAIGDRQELSTYMNQIWQNKMNENTSIHKYYQRTKEHVQNIKILSKQNATYKQSWEAISTFINEFALAAFIAGLRDPYFGHVQAARPKDIEDAYAFLCKFRSQQISSSRTDNTERKPMLINKPKSNNNNIKPNVEAPKEKTHQHFKNHVTDTSEKMEVDPSLRSRLTLNRKLINNNEFDSESDSSQSENDDDSVAINFCSVGSRITET